MRRIALLTATAVALAACGAHSQPAAPAPGASAAFMAKTAKEPGVISLPDGLEYKIIKSGPPAASCPSSAMR